VELKRLISHFTYRIEPKPEGGFIAHGSDPGVPGIEAATRGELQQKIQSSIAVALGTEFPGLKIKKSTLPSMLSTRPTADSFFTRLMAKSCQSLERLTVSSKASWRKKC